MRPSNVPQLSVLIADDEPVALRGLKRLVNSRDDLHVVAECDNGLEAVELISRWHPDLLVLDVQMPGLNGLDVARRIGASEMPMVVFVTAFDEFAIAAFEMAAVDYVVKPFSDERLMLALDRALARRTADVAATELSRLLDLVARETRTPRPVELEKRTVVSTPTRERFRERFLVSVGRRNAVVHANDVAWIRANGYYATLVTRDRREYLVRVPLEQLERELDPEKFLRVHRSAIVGLSEIHGLERGTGGARVVVLHAGERIPISKSRRDTVFHALGRWA
jgi:two-component system, LytTR family, response regulator